MVPPSPHNVKVDMTHCLSYSFTYGFIEMLSHFNTIISLVTTFEREKVYDCNKGTSYIVAI